MRPLPAPARAAIGHFDRRADAAADGIRGNRFADRLFYGASELGDFSLLWLIFGALRGLRSERGWRAAIRVGAALGIESVLVNLLIKSVFRRDRPSWDLDRPMRIRRPRTSSFPSGHATSSFLSAALLGENDRLWPLYYATAVVVSSSRVYVKIHHASDVVAGAAIGALLGHVARRVAPLPPAGYGTHLRAHTALQAPLTRQHH